MSEVAFNVAFSGMRFGPVTNARSRTATLNIVSGSVSKKMVPNVKIN